MKNLLASGMLLLVMSCGLLDIDSPMGMSRLDTMRHPDQEDGPDKAAGRPGTYITAVDFEEDYDWRRDTAYGQARGNIILYKDSKPILSLEAGPGTGISTDLDRHHFIGGHLYTEYSDGRQTIIKMDGDEICRYEGNEVIKGMIADKDALYVLSQNASGEGFTLRKNWKPVLVKSGGMPLGSMNDPSYSPSGALYKDNGQICMAYYRSPGPGNGAKAWHFIRGQNESEIRLPTGMETICDIKSIGGHLCIAGRATDGKTPIICIDDACHRIEGTGPVGNDLRCPLRMSRSLPFRRR